MITLSATDTLSGSAGTGSAVTYTIVGDDISGGADSFGVLAQGTLGSSVSTLINTATGHQRLIKSIFLSNTTGSAVYNIIFFANGTSSSNQLVSLQIPAYGSASYESGQGWRVYDITGALATTSIQGATGTAGTPGATGATGATGPTQVYFGTATINFGATPGTNYVTTTVTGQSAILTTSVINIFMMADSTATHNAIEHQIVPIKLTASNIVAGTGFTINAYSEWRLSGTFSVRWAWNN